MLAALRSALYMAFLIVTVIPYAMACLLWAPLPQGWRYRLTVGWPKLALWGARWIVGIRWQVRGLENLPDAPVIVLSKHQSAWETLFFPATMPRQVCFVYKKELHLVPFFGWGLGLLNMIAIDRASGRDSVDQVVRVGGQRLREGRWPLLFPEGTRTAPGTTGRYRVGGALLAARTGAPILPVAHNAGRLWRRKAFIKRAGIVTVSFGPLIHTQGLDAQTINTRVKDWIEGEMRRISPQDYGDGGDSSGGGARAAA